MCDKKKGKEKRKERKKEKRMTKQVSSHGDFSPVLSYFILTSKFAKLQILPGLSTEQL